MLAFEYECGHVVGTGRRVARRGECPRCIEVRRLVLAPRPRGRHMTRQRDGVAAGPYRFQYQCGHTVTRQETGGELPPRGPLCPSCQAKKDAEDAAARGPILWDGFAGALLGLLTCPDGVERAVYSVGHMVDVLVGRDGMTEEDAEEHLGFNVLGAYVGPATPLHVRWEWPVDLMVPAGPGEPAA